MTQLAGTAFVAAAQRRNLYQRLKLTRAIGAGLDALITRAADDGEATPDTLDHMATLSGYLGDQQEQLARWIAEGNNTA